MLYTHGATMTDRRSELSDAGGANSVYAVDRAVHDWYRFVLSFPPHLVEQYVVQFGLDGDATVLDPFCGTGTTLVECKKLGIRSIGVEAHPMPFFATSVKINWDPDPNELIRHAVEVHDEAKERLYTEGLIDETLPLFGTRSSGTQQVELRNLPPEQERLLLKDSISPRPLHKALVLLETLAAREKSCLRGHEQLAFAKAVVRHASNLHFGPEVGVGKIKGDAPVVGPWLEAVQRMASDLREVACGPAVSAAVYHADARELPPEIEPESVDAVITSPPYPNEKDYTRTTRLESVLLGLIRDKEGLRATKQGLVRSNTRNVFKADDDEKWVADNEDVQRIAREIEGRRVALGKTSGFERLYHKVTKHYFGGMSRHLAELRRVLRPGAQLAYVVGDQASYLRVMIRTASLLSQVALSLGYDVVGTDLFRTRLATATGEQLREEVLLLRWPGTVRRK